MNAPLNPELDGGPPADDGRESFQLRNGNRLKLSAAHRALPAEYFLGVTHARVCTALAKSSALPDQLLPVYTNLLFMQSAVARRLTALVTLVNRGELDPAAVSGVPLFDRVAHLADSPVQAHLPSSPVGDLVDAAYFRRFLLKALAHRLFRLFSRTRIRAGEVIRAWVDSTDQAYPREVESAALLIYPYSDSIGRQLRYIRECVRRKRTFTLCGLPYRLGDLWRLARCTSGRDEAIVRAAANAFDDHAAEVRRMGARVLYTTDEFDWAGVRMHSALRQWGIATVNTSHSVEVYGPHVDYAHFRFFNDCQRAYYASHGTVGAFSLREVGGIGDNDPDAAGEGPVPLVVLLEGNWSPGRYPYEAGFQAAAMRCALMHCRDLGLPVAVKLHPSAPASNRRWYREMGASEVIGPLDTLTGRRPVFLTVRSTAYYECLGYGPVLFLGDSRLRQDWLLGGHVTRVQLNELKETLARLKSPTAWTGMYRQQVDAELLSRQIAGSQPFAAG